MGDGVSWTKTFVVKRRELWMGIRLPAKKVMRESWDYEGSEMGLSAERELKGLWADLVRGGWWGWLWGWGNHGSDTISNYDEGEVFWVRGRICRIWMVWRLIVGWRRGCRVSCKSGVVEEENWESRNMVIGNLKFKRGEFFEEDFCTSTWKGKLVS